MAFSAAGNRGPLAEINVTPLVDVMLVLLIIFIVTAPMLTRTITMDLPQRTSAPSTPLPPPDPIQLRLDASGQLFWNAAPLPLRNLQPRLQEAMAQAAGNPPELRIDASPDAEYASMAKVLAAAKNADVKRIGFVQAH
ncbi:biopolymer transporter ExbD [Xanthomonas sp. NCPPB 1128]|uniref:ExbD/TolR family protein n=1 Tax=Xanthomonas sp. NCPPB 1128 TaxID=1775876 RepID=UPI00065A9F99|nr:biopolymer transporter ExbD [Xanthomonas sp. NCPPB 1128]KMM74978.1 biopolymer transporter ExbD [Xanthomonas sp. NCPPB 1128]